MSRPDEEFRKVLPGIVKKVIFFGPYDADSMLLAIARDLDDPTWHDHMTRGEKRAVRAHRETLDFYRTRLEEVRDERRRVYLQATFETHLQHYADCLREVYTRWAEEE